MGKGAAQGIVCAGSRTIADPARADARSVQRLVFKRRCFRNRLEQRNQEFVRREDMRRRWLIAFVMIAFVSLTGCETLPTVSDEHKGAATGAGIGAATGAVLGAVVGKDAKGAVIGGLVGALVGGVIGHYYYDQRRSENDTAKKYGYDASQGTLLKIEDAAATPRIAEPGGTVELKMTYAFLSDQKDVQHEVVEKREIRLGGELVGNPEVTMQRSGGTFTSSVPLTLPETAKKGLYIVTFKVKSGKVSDEMQTSFTVR